MVAETTTRHSGRSTGQVPEDEAPRVVVASPGSRTIGVTVHAVAGPPVVSAHPVDHGIRSLARWITRVVIVFAVHPRLPVVECFEPVSFDPTPEPLLAGRIDPDQEAQVFRPLRAAGRDSLDDHDWCRLDCAPLGERLRRPVVALVDRSVASRERLDHPVEHDRPPVDGVVG